MSPPESTVPLSHRSPLRTCVPSRPMPWPRCRLRGPDQCRHACVTLGTASVLSMAPLRHPGRPRVRRGALGSALCRLAFGLPSCRGRPGQGVRSGTSAGDRSASYAAAAGFSHCRNDGGEVALRGQIRRRVAHLLGAASVQGDVGLMSRRLRCCFAGLPCLWPLDLFAPWRRLGARVSGCLLSQRVSLGCQAVGGDARRPQPWAGIGSLRVALIVLPLGRSEVVLSAEFLFVAYRSHAESRPAVARMRIFRVALRSLFTRPLVARAANSGEPLARRRLRSSKVGWTAAGRRGPLFFRLAAPVRAFGMSRLRIGEINWAVSA